MEITVRVESTGADVKIEIDSSTTVAAVIEMVARSPRVQRKFVFSLNFVSGHLLILTVLFVKIVHLYRLWTHFGLTEMQTGH